MSKSRNKAILAFLVVAVFCLENVTSQQYFYTHNFGNAANPPPQQTFPRNQNQPIQTQTGFQFPSQNQFSGQQSQTQTLGSRSNFPQRNNVPPPRNGQGQQQQAGGNLQEQFAEIFNWNNDLTNDTRFRACTVPDIGDVSRACPKRAFYFGLNPQHRRAVGMVKTILTRPNDPRQTICLAGAMRDLPGMNPNVWIRGMLGAHLSDVGLFDLQVPPIVEVMPSIFLSNDALRQAKTEAQRDPSQRQCTVIDGSSGRDNGVENLLWYFREDVQVNSFHLNWHLIYPFTGITQRPDRSGELFYFSHHSHLARYHAERLSNRLGKVVPLNIAPFVAVPESYNPHLDDVNSGMSWSARRPNANIQDTTFIALEGVPPNISVADRRLHVKRVEEAIANRALLLPNGQTLPLNTIQGIDHLGHVIEASIFSANGGYYGQFGFHNEGHVLLAFIEDPQNRTGIPPGVLLEVATAMRDPVFYTYHSSMDETFNKHKKTLPSYQPLSGDFPLQFDGIEITSVKVRPDNNGFENTMTTFLNQKTFELSRGLDFNRSGVQGSVKACVTHLDHVGFTYEIYVNRERQASTNRATVRIFLAPRFDEAGRRYSMLEQRTLMFMLDLFTVQLNQVGANRIVRRSIDSALTIEIPQSLLSENPTQIPNQLQRQYCGCGWPHHMLIPRGNEQGMAFDLFVMLTNGNEDYVAPRNNNRVVNDCRPAPIYCGRLNDTYPDARPMGYPFDRLPYNAPIEWWESPRYVKDLEEYTLGIPNMAAIQVRIQHAPQLNRRPQPSQSPGRSPSSSSRPGASSNQFTNTVSVPQTVTSQPQPSGPQGQYSGSVENVPLLYQEHSNLGNRPGEGHSHHQSGTSQSAEHEHDHDHYSQEDFETPSNENNQNQYQGATSSGIQIPNIGLSNAFQAFGTYGQQPKSTSYFVSKYHNYAVNT